MGTGQNYFRGVGEKPFHLSVGAALVNQKGQVACHYFKDKNIYILMRETLEPNETIEQALARGLKEEFGAQAGLTTYLGTILSEFDRDGHSIEKATIYFLCKLTDFDISRRDENDPEFGSDIQWHQPEYLIAKMHGQAHKLKRTDLDESIILERVVQTIGNSEV